MRSHIGKLVSLRDCFCEIHRIDGSVVQLSLYLGWGSRADRRVAEVWRAIQRSPDGQIYWVDDGHIFAVDLTVPAKDLPESRIARLIGEIFEHGVDIFPRKRWRLVG